jgi:hypothetical protein
MVTGTQHAPPYRRRPPALPRVPLLDVDPELFQSLGACDLALAHRISTVDVAALPHGPWKPGLPAGGCAAHMGYLILEGLVCRHMRLAQLGAPELLGPGDVLCPWIDDRPYASVEPRCEWTILEPLRVAILDARFAATVVRWPSVLAALSSRTTLRTRGLMLRLALARVGRVEERLLLMLWHLADRWGRVGPDGVILPLRLTHALLGELIGAHRPTVTVAARKLAEQGHVERLPGKTWLLKGPPPEVPVDP